MSAPLTLLPYQARWVEDHAGLLVAEKSRRIGFSWAEAYGAVMHAAEGRGNVYYQSYALEMARGFIDDCAGWAERAEMAASAVGESLLDLGDGHAVQTYRIRFKSGREILAMSSAPRAFRSRGKPGDLAIVDEAAFVDDLAEVLKSAMAFRVWGGQVHVISTHNGEGSPFAALCRDIREGVQPGSLHTVPLRLALDEGLYRRICEVSRAQWSPEAQAQWEADLRADYGANADEELDCIPSAGGGAWLSWELIRAAEHEAAGDPSKFAGGSAWVGVDIARRRDLWVAAAVEKVGDVLWVRDVREERNIKFSQQKAIVEELADLYRPVRIAVDQTGMGEAFVEQLQDAMGESLVEGVLFTAPRRLSMATALLEAVEDRRLRIPNREEWRKDLHSVKKESGRSGAPRLVAEREKGGRSEQNTGSHADRFWALCLACAAAAEGGVPFQFASSGRRRVVRNTDPFLAGGPGLEPHVTADQAMRGF